MNEVPTKQEILQSMLDTIPDTFDKRQGSIIYDALAPAATELAKMYIELYGRFELVFIDTSSGEYLDRIVMQNGVSRKPATNAIRKGIFSMEIPIGSRFGIEDVSYEAIELINGFNYKLRCLSSGNIGNKYFGTLTPITYIKGLESAELAEIIDVGEDIESDNDLRDRYIQTVLAPQFGGNVSDYKIKTKELEGVGGVKVIPIWNGGGTVKLIITSSTNQVPTTNLINEVQEAIDPTNDGTGLGIAPIGHIVTVLGATASNINVSTNLTLESGKTASDVQNAVNEVVNNYFSYLRSKWDESQTLIVRISEIDSRLLGVPGVLDVTNTKLNSNASNIEIESDKIPFLNGSVVITA